jgi:isocitrate dehydrogenase kinase/phosphatase
MADTGLEFALEVENKHLREAIKELGRNLGEVSSKQAFAENIVRGLKNPDVIMHGGSVTMDRIQVMETGEIRLLPPEPAPITETCVKAPEPDKNGKKPEKEPVKEAVNAS